MWNLYCPENRGFALSSVLISNSEILCYSGCFFLGRWGDSSRQKVNHVLVTYNYKIKSPNNIKCCSLYFVNALPSYCQKYKDISIINNYQLLLAKNCKRLYAPAINPFEVYNLLDGCIDESRTVSIAPLCTKPMSLGICLYALEHQNVRIIYPFSDRYESHRSYDVYKSYIYKIPREW